MGSKGQKKHIFDILIVGGGPIGMTAALMLSQNGFKVGLLDQVDYQDILKESYDGRTFACSYGSKLIFESLGLWPALENKSVPILDILVTAEGGRSGIHYSAKDMGHPMGYNLETRYFRSALYRALQDEKNFNLFTPCQIEQVIFHEIRVEIFLKSGELLSASLCLGAEGKNSFLRAQAGLKTYRVPYHQTALVFVVEHQKPHHFKAYEHFLTTGPLALLPMVGQRSAVIWSLKDSHAEVFQKLDNNELSQELEEQFFSILGSLKVVGERWVFPLEMVAVREYVAPRLVVIGDAAHAIHPVAGQGFNLGLRDIALLSQHIKEGSLLGLDLGSLCFLKAYEKKRRLDIMSMTGMCDGLVRLFSNTNLLLKQIRLGGLEIVNHLPPLKKVLTRHAMGLPFKEV